MSSEQFCDMFHSEKFAKSSAVFKAIESQDRDNIIDLNEMAKTTQTIDMDSERFTGILSQYSKK